MTKISNFAFRTAAVASCFLLIFYTMNYLTGDRRWQLAVTLWHKRESSDFDHSPNTSSTRQHDILFFSRVPKTGSEMFVLLLSWLQRQNDFTHVRLRSDVRHLRPQEQKSLVSEMQSRVRAAKTRLVSFDRHLHFLDFRELGLEGVSYFSVVREPIEKLTSRFYYARATPRPGGYTPPGGGPTVPKDVPPFPTVEECITAQHPQCTFVPGKPYDLTIPYFCGHAPYCSKLGSLAAYNTAVHRLNSSFTVVGVLGHLNTTLAVLQAKLPRFFAGVWDLYFSELGAPHLNKNYQRPPSLAPWAEEALRANLTLELKFYDLVRQRLFQQAAELGIPP